MSIKALVSDSIWKHFLALSEDLLNQPDTHALMNLVKTQICSQFNCDTEIYPVSPSYPLPGEDSLATLPSTNCPDLVAKAFAERKLQKGDAIKKDGSAIEVALMLLTQETLLAVLHVSRQGKTPFSADEIDLLQSVSSFIAVSMQVNRQVILKNWRFDQIALVRVVSSQIANVLDLDELCRRVTASIRNSFGFYFVSIFTVESGTDILRFRASSGGEEPSTQPLQINLKVGEGMVGSTAQTGEEHIAKDVDTDPFFKPSDRLPDTKAEATLPLIVEGNILGVLDIQSCRHESFHENDMLVLRSLADNIALAVKSAHLFSKVEKRAARMNAVLEVNDAISSILDLDKLLVEVVNRIHERFNYPFVHIFTVHSGRRKVIYHTGSGKRSVKLRTNAFAYNLDAPKGIIPYVARTGKPMLVNNVNDEPFYVPSKLPPHNTLSELTIPLVFGSDVLGILDLQSDKLDSFDQEDLELFEGLASVIAVALRNANLFRTERWRREVADGFQDIARLLSGNVDLPTVLEKILTVLEEILPCEASAIWLLDGTNTPPGEENRLRLAAAHGISARLISQTLAECKEVRDFINGSLQVDGPSIRPANGPFGPLGKSLKYPKNYSSISIPLRAGDHVLGSLTFAHHLEGRYGSEASTISATLANYAAVAIQNARLFSAAQQEAWSSTVMLQVSEACQSITSEDELLSTMSRLAPLLVGIDQCCFYLYDPAQSVFLMKAWYGFHPKTEEQTLNELDSIPLLKLIATQAPVFVTNPPEELKLASLEFSSEEHTVLLLPMLVRDDFLGAFLVSHKAEIDSAVENKFNDQMLAILQGLTRQTGVALENIRLVENRQEDAYITAVLLQVAQAVVSQNRLKDILDTIMNLMPILVGIETCVIYLWDKEKKSFKPAQVIAGNHAFREWLGEKSYFPGEFPILDELMKDQKLTVCRLESPILTEEKWASVSCLTIPDGNLDILRTANNWLLGFPLSTKGECFGALVAVENDVPSKFQAKRVELLTGVAQQISLAIQDDRLNQEMIIRERMEQEIQLARQIQKTFLPDSLPQFEGWKFDLRWSTAREVGGDFYDLFFLPNGKIAVVIADVSDKGMPAALYMTVTRTLIRSSAKDLCSPSKILTHVNDLLASENQSSGMFVTTVFAIIEPETGILTYSIAGHNLPLLWRAESRKVEPLKKGGIALGVIDNPQYNEHETKLEPGDELLFYTDGVTETFSPTDDQFSEIGLNTAFLESRDQNQKNTLEFIEDRLLEFRGDLPLADDITMISITRQKTGPS